MAIEPQPEAERPRRFDPRDPGRSGLQRRTLFTFVFAVAVFLLVASISTTQMTTQSASLKVIRAGIVATTELDLLLAEQEDALTEAAESDDPPESLTLTGYPIDISFTVDEIRSLSTAELRERILSESTTRVYLEGISAFDTDDEAEIGLLTIEGFINQASGFYSEGVHNGARTAAIVFFVVAAVSALGMTMAAPGFERLRTPGLSAGFAGLIGLAGVYVAKFLVDLLAGSDPLNETFASVVSTSLDVPLRNFLVVFVAGAALWAAGFGGALAARLAEGAALADEHGASAADEGPVAAPPPPPPPAASAETRERLMAARRQRIADHEQHAGRELPVGELVPGPAEPDEND